MTNDEIVEAVRRMKRTAEMSAGIMRDKQRTGAWEGAEKVADQFDRLAERASDVFAALTAAQAENEKLRAALVEHNDMLRSAFSAAQRDAIADVAGTTNYRTLADRASEILAKHHAVTNDARAALSPPPLSPEKP